MCVLWSIFYNRNFEHGLKRSRFKSWFNVTCNVSLWFLKRDLIAFRHLVANPVSQILSRRVKVKKVVEKLVVHLFFNLPFNMTEVQSPCHSRQAFLHNNIWWQCRYVRAGFGIYSHMSSVIGGQRLFQCALIYSTWYWEVFNSVCKFTRKRVIIKNCVGQLTYSQGCLGVLQTC